MSGKYTVTYGNRPPLVNNKWDDTGVSYDEKGRIGENLDYKEAAELASTWLEEGHLFVMLFEVEQIIMADKQGVYYLLLREHQHRKEHEYIINHLQAHIKTTEEKAAK